ncbi:hypothetical protein NQ314_001429, partial [Rhamnusium bicolor]
VPPAWLEDGPGIGDLKKMNCSDHYQDLLHYLEQTEQPKKKEINEKDTEKTTIEDIDLEFLIKLNETIKSDISELLAKNELNESTIADCQFYNNNVDNGINGFTYINGTKLYEDERFHKHLIESDTLSDTIGSDSLGNSINLSDHNAIHAATQTSPSLSPSSTNLTWASECSSSPCLTSTSDSDLLDEDAQSTSSTDGRDHLLITWASKQRWQQVNKQSRSQSDRHLAEIEAAEACKWLRATGFPQYAQLYEDMQFPIEVATAAQDHPLLEPDVLHSLFRRLQILNSCAHLHQQRVTHTDESEDEYCALSDNWTYQTDIRRWSRTCNKMPAQNVEETANRLENVTHEKDDVFEKCTESPKERLRRAGSTKFRRRRDGVLFSDRDNVLDSISQQLSDLKSCEVNHVSDSEITPRHTRRTRTKSFDKTDMWSHPHSTTERVIWQKLPEKEVHSLERNVSLDNNGPLMSHLSCTQLQVLRKLALLKLTAHMEKYCPSHRTGWNWDLPKFIRKIKPPVYKDKNLFGVPLTVTFQRTGQVLPRNIEEAMRWLQQNAADQVGIFRKPGVKSRIQSLRNMVESNVGVNFADQQCYDVADMVKQYFRELPEALLTNKLSETFILIFQYVPPYLRRESVLCALLLMPDEHIEVLQALLHFLLTISKHSQVNQMNESNIAMCFAPSLFHYSQAYKQNLGSPHPKELAENKAGHDCLLYFLKNFNSLFRIPQEFLNQCKSSEIKDTKAKLLTDLGREIGGWREYLNECQSNLLKEAREKCRGWIPVSPHNLKVEISYKKVADGLPLRLWKVSAEIEAPPSEVLHRVLRERHVWDPDLQSAKIVCQLDKRSEVFQYVRKNISPLPNEEYSIVRTGRTPEWYQKNFGHLCALFLANIQNSFYQNTIGPESKV